MKRLILGVALVTVTSLAFAQSFPNRPIRLLVGFAPGGSSDIVARLIAARVNLGQPVVVENRAGAGGLIASDVAAKAPPDGYTWIILPSGHATQAVMVRKLPFDPLNDFTWTTTLTTYPMMFAVSPDSPIKSFADMLERARSSPGKISFSSVGVGTGMHLMGEWINAVANVQLTHIPYKGFAPAFTDVLEGRVSVMIDTTTAMLPQIRAGKLRPLAVSSLPGKQLVPGIAAASETLPGVDYDSWLGIAMPAKVPAEISSRVHQALVAALAQEDVQKRLTELGGAAAPATPEQFRARVERDIAKFREIVESRKIPPAE